ncbi:MAG: MATE family efflux transporter [Reyranella sp.]|uniref:MATE family efflux transporter n=1 Tax=Reyranella sp. TaxID=1929291 RepID=UPI002731320F|nr:MATE family efflux transporter [Reyranella sp.]MDP1965586.1 MATE family efflux transporter [Reyranella sp.]MDP2376158.1 MATE family efflux transporter [Reyranella sp.]
MSHPLLTAPIGRSLLRLAGPTTGFMAVQIVVAIAETWFIARLGADALAGFALVLPFLVLMHNMANGGMGGGVASALARAVGGGRHEDARALVLHALVLAAAFALAFAILGWTVAPTLYRLMGGNGQAFAQALFFGNVIFAGCVVVWTSAFLAALLRGAGDAATPGRYGIAMSVVYVPLAGVLTLGIGSWPGLGMAGPGFAGIVTMGGQTLLLARAVWRGRLGVVPRLRSVRLQRRLFGDILHVGIMGSFTTVVGSLSALLMTGLVGRFGTEALAGYGVGMRLEYMVSPLAYGIGTGLTTLVGVAAGAQDSQRAIRVAWIGGLASFVLIGMIGWTAALLPEAWSRLFTSDPQVIAASTAYLTHVAPFYCLLGLGIALYFASQGAGRMTVPVVAGLMRVAVATAGGWFAVEHMGSGLDGVFAAMAVGMAVYGCAIAVPLLVRPWHFSDPNRGSV